MSPSILVYEDKVFLVRQAAGRGRYEEVVHILASKHMFVFVCVGVCVCVCERERERKTPLPAHPASYAQNASCGRYHLVS